MNLDISIIIFPILIFVAATFSALNKLSFA